MLDTLLRWLSWPPRRSPNHAPGDGAAAAPGTVTFRSPAAPAKLTEPSVRPGDLGAAAMAGVHRGTVTAPGATPDPRRVAAPLLSSYAPRDSRSFRPRGASGITAGAIPWDELDDKPGEPELHVGPPQHAAPDARRVYGAAGKPAGYALAPAEQSASAEEHYNGVQLVANDSAYIDRPRAGAADPREGRPASVRRFLFVRPFDKIAADTFSGYHDALPAPLASTPLSYADDVVGAVPHPGGRFAARGMESGAGGAVANTYREAPRPWDEYAVNLPAGVDAAQVAAGAARARGWRAR